LSSTPSSNYLPVFVTTLFLRQEKNVNPWNVGLHAISMFNKFDLLVCFRGRVVWIVFLPSLEELYRIFEKIKLKVAGDAAPHLLLTGEEF